MYANTAMTDSLYKQNILILFASPNPNGNTAKLVEQMQDRLGYSYVFDRLDLYQMNIHPCIDCGICKNGLCHLNHTDHYAEIMEKIQRADVIAIASPLYFAGFPAPLKAVIDRTQQFFINGYAGRRITFPERKKGVLLMTCGSKADPAIEDYISIPTKMFFDCINAEYCGKLIISNTDEKPDFYVDFEPLIRSFHQRYE